MVGGVAHGESPPRARGRVTVWSMVTQDEGITPACAGKSSAGRAARSRIVESPPRARGRANPRHSTCQHQRNHPRVRGEEPCLRLPSLVSSESPPRARGRVQGRAGISDRLGITPACAGKSGTAYHYAGTGRNHPRVRGEEAIRMTGAGFWAESPPRARGRAGDGGRQALDAGNHPRVRGEESNENASSEDMVIPPKCKFFALFSRAALKRRVIPNAGPGAFRLSNFCLYSSLCVPA